MRRHPRLHLWTLALLSLAALSPGWVSAQGNLLVTPRRLIFDKGPRVRELNLANTGKDTARYAISFMEIKMNEDGSFEQITTPDSGQRFASGNLRVFPRGVIIPPGESQVVKVQLMKADELAEGEYRSHIYIRALPMEQPLGDTSGQKATGISVKLNAIFGISIPAIVRIGENNTKVTLAHPSFVMMDEKTPHLSVELHRSGLMSSYGNITVDCIGKDGTTTRVGLVKGIAVYTPNTIRRFQMNLDNTHKVDYSDCELRIRYSTEKDASPEDSSEVAIALHPKK